MFTRLILLAWRNRCSSDERTLGGMFYELCDKMSELNWAVALTQLLDLLHEALAWTKNTIKK
ncbi:hypothetical protein GCM10007968_28120 [Sporolactobacillus putidus]|uniref:Uncharacterized protein n=1 Tax=Sporolactobacillus putidus TaxID=492735 RepID=A0A917W4H2_9BACL|nr:hypothetical protein GCM10007968_28120 [Sporolactobacillus putidus]